MSGEQAPQQNTKRKSVGQAEYMRVGAAAAFVSMNVKTFRDCIPDIPGVVKLSERGIRIPKTGLIAWARQFQIAR